MTGILLYSPLDKSQEEIRLITINCCENDEAPVSCRLETVSLANSPEYAAMSYVWGDATITEKILVNGEAFSATTNLNAGLWHFRKYGLVPGKEKGLRLWVDAICINQQDTAERNQQVALMGDIYANASYVLSWLGLPGKHRIDNSLRLMQSFSQAIPDDLAQAIINMVEKSGDSSDGKRGDDDDDDDDGEASKIARPKSTDEYEIELVKKGLDWISEHSELHELDASSQSSNIAWNSFTALTNLAYWGRVWIQQERVLCKSPEVNLIRCGSELTTFEDFILFFTFIHALDRNSITPPEINAFEWESTMMTLKVPIVSPVISMRAAWKRGTVSPNLVPRLAQRCVATNPRDMIYGLRSLLHLEVDVSYEKAVREVYLDWHSQALQYSRERRIFERCGIGHAGRGLSEENEHNLPSWLPDLTISHERRYVFQSGVGLELAPDGRFQSLGICGQQYSDDGVLTVQGVICDRVCKTTLVMAEPDDPMEALRELIIDYILEMKARDHPTGIRPLQALYYTIHQGIDPINQEPFPAEPDPRSVSAQFFRVVALYEQAMTLGQDWSHIDLEAAGGIDQYLDSRFRDTTSAGENERWRDSLAEISEGDFHQASQQFVSSFLVYWEGKAVFYTADGYIGLGPKYSQVGDQLCVINNCHLPVLLRAEDSGHVLVGAVYVHGICGDEALEMIKSGKLKLEEFKIH